MRDQSESPILFITCLSLIQTKSHYFELVPFLRDRFTSKLAVLGAFRYVRLLEWAISAIKAINDGNSPDLFAAKIFDAFISNPCRSAIVGRELPRAAQHPSVRYRELILNYGIS